MQPGSQPSEWKPLRNRCKAQAMGLTGEMLREAGTDPSSISLFTIISEAHTMTNDFETYAYFMGNTYETPECDLLMGNDQPATVQELLAQLADSEEY